MKFSREYYTSAMVAEITGVTSHVLRYWEQHHHFIKPRRVRDGSQRLYRPVDIALLQKVKRLADFGVTHKGINKLYQSYGTKEFLKLEL